MDLKWLLVRRIVLVAVACFVVGSGFAVAHSAFEARAQNEQLADSVERQLSLQLVRIESALDVPKRFPDWDLITTYALRPGQCVQYHAPDEKVMRSSCQGVEASANDTPIWFSKLYKLIPSAEPTVTRALVYRGKIQGSVVVSSDAVATSAQAWTTIAPMLGLSAALIAALCAMTYWVIDSALASTKEILGGLNRLAQGDLTSRLPNMRLAELNRISEVFNSLVGDLAKATAERTELARKLVDAQEKERVHIARELHDEIAQQLSAINAVAASVRRKIDRADVTASDDVRTLEGMTSKLMVSLRKTLAYLRPSEIDDLGLVPSIRDLVDKHNETAKGATRYTLETEGSFEDLSVETSAHVYRIIQEALNNAAKHAQARSVRVMLNKIHEAGTDKIALAVEDDGRGRATQSGGVLGGSGLIGMRERVLALSGRFSAGPNAGGGFGLHAEFNAHPGY